MSHSTPLPVLSVSAGQSGQRWRRQWTMCLVNACTHAYVLCTDGTRPPGDDGASVSNASVSIYKCAAVVCTHSMQYNRQKYSMTIHTVVV